MRLLALRLVLVASLACGFAAAAVAKGALPRSQCDTAELDTLTRQFADMQVHMDALTEPCEDFYEYACGNWRAPYALRSLHAYDTLTAVKADNKRLLIAYFENAKPSGTVTYKDDLAYFFNSCMEQHVSDNGTQPLHAYTEALRQVSEWPILSPYFTERTANTSFNWEYVSGELQRYGVHSFWRLFVLPNWQSADQQIVYITPLKVDLLPNTGEDAVYLYKRYVKYLLLDLGVRVRKANSIADEVSEFLLQLLRVLTDKQPTVLLKEPQTLAALIAQLPHLQLRKYFSTLLQDFPAVPSDYESKLLIVADTAYLRKLSDLLRSTRADVIGKYLLVQFLTHFEVNLHDNDTNMEQKENCLQQLHTFLPNELAWLFLELQQPDSAAFLQSANEHMHEIFGRVKVQFEKMLNATSIFDRDAVSRVMGLEKLRAMRLLLPNVPTTVQQPPVLETEQSYDLNLLKLSRLKMYKELGKILPLLMAQPADVFGGKPPPAADTTYSPLNVNAYYRLKKNAIEIPVGLLRAPFYADCMEAPRIYGSFVYIVAHELLHGFDYDGWNYDKSGNVAAMWSAKAIIKFGSKSKCYMTERYSNAPLTINENIADNEGLRLALATYLESRTAAGDATLEPLKVFFTSFAQNWCGASAGASSATIKLHASHKERVNNVVGNFAEFADVFGCKNNSRMNPAEKCAIW